MVYRDDRCPASYVSRFGPARLVGGLEMLISTRGRGDESMRCVRTVAHRAIFRNAAKRPRVAEKVNSKAL
eukprot:7378272-Prymnesium_polylepis.1